MKNSTPHLQSRQLSRTLIGFLGITPAAIIATLLVTGCSNEVATPPWEGRIGEIDYVNVRDEPQHRHEFENGHVRIYDVSLPGGHVTLYHAHLIDTLYLVVSGSSLKSTAIAGSLTIPVALPVPSGMVFLNEHASNPLVHQVNNTGKTAARLVGVELKQESAPFTREPLSGHGLALREAYDKVRVYDVELAPGESTGKINRPFTGIIVALSEATVAQAHSGSGFRTASFEPASWEWYEQAASLTLSNKGVSDFEAVLYEFP